MHLTGIVYPVMIAEYSGDILILFGSFLAFLLCIGQLILKRRDGRNCRLAVALLMMGIDQFCLSCHLIFSPEIWFRIYPFLNTLRPVAVYIFIPIAAIYLYTLPDPEIRFQARHLIHFIPVMLALVVISISAEYPPPGDLGPREYNLYLFRFYPVYKLLGFGSVIQALVYLTVLIKSFIDRSRTIYGEKKSNSIALLIFIIITGGIIVLTALISHLGLIRRYDIRLLNYVYMFRFTIITIILFLAGMRFPFFIHIVDPEALQNYYKNSQIRNIRVEAIIENLERLMVEQRLYSDETLTIKKTAERLGITAYQLSELLNTRMHRKFTAYVKEKRIAEACSLLTSRKDLKIIEVALECGFHSLSSFNAAFKELERCSPSEYRKRKSPEV